MLFSRSTFKSVSEFKSSVKHQVQLYVVKNVCFNYEMPEKFIRVN